MKRTEMMDGPFLSLSKSSSDGNRLYSILLDARASAATESMYDTVEKLLAGEKENAKEALDRLWALKKGLEVSKETSTLDLLIQFYQNKIDVLRDREETIRSISRDSRNLIEEKRKRDAELASIKQQIQEGSREIEDLSARIHKLKTKEQELQLIETQVRKELCSNENEVINGLYEIILPPDSAPRASDNLVFDDKLTEKQEPAETTPAADDTAFSVTAATHIDWDPGSLRKHLTVEPPPEPFVEPQPPAIIPATAVNDETAADDSDVVELYKTAPLADTPPYPKSVVKTTSGRVIGEYYYDASVYKNRRHYIFNSIYFHDELSASVKRLCDAFDAATWSDVRSMVKDIMERLTKNDQIHLENSTNEILNPRTLNELWNHLGARSFVDVGKFCGRMRAKLDALGVNYVPMLKSQMERYFAGE